MPVVEPFFMVRRGPGEEGLTEVGLSMEDVKAMRRARAGGWIILHPRPHRQRIVNRGGHRGQGRTRNGGRGQRGRGSRILNLPKQGAFHILGLRQKMEFSVLAVPKDRADILGRDTEGLRLAASSKPV